MENSYSQIKNIVSGSNIDRILILGKGASARKIPKSVFENFLVITLNDSEIIYPGTFAITHRPWVLKNLQEKGFKSQCYISDVIINSEISQVKVPYYPFSEDSLEFMLESLNQPDVFVTDFLFITALQLCLTIAKIKDKKNIEVYFAGFDFEVSVNNEKSIRTDSDDLEFKKVFLQTQEAYFKLIINHLHSNNEGIKIKHIGNKSYSSLTVQRFVELKSYHSEIKKPKALNSELYEHLKNEAIDGKTLIVAELTNNHIGDAERLKKMIRLAKDAGADFIKVQKRDVENFYTKEELKSPYDSPFGSTLWDYRSAVELDENLFELLNEECIKNEIAWFSSVLDYNSLEFVLRYDCPLVKLPSTISNHRNYIKKVANNYTNDIVVSTGFTSQEYEDFIIDLFLKEQRMLWFLQCSSSYPTPPEACQISVVRHYSKIQEKYPNLMPGYSSHDVGAIGSMLAVAAGAKMIEKHVKLGDLDWVHFDGVALDLYNNQFKDFVDNVRKSELMCGSETKHVHQQEHHKYSPNKNHN